MSKATKSMQINFMMPDRPGLLAETTTALANANVNISGICAYEMEDQATFMLLTDNNEKALQVLAQRGLEAKEYPMVAVEMPDEVGALQGVAKKIADAGINIIYMYGTAGVSGSAVIIFATSDNDKAIEAINA